MAVPNYTRNVSFTVGNNGELLTSTNIKEAIKERLSITTEEDYARKLSEGITNIQFAIFVSNTRISINNSPYAQGELIQNLVFEVPDFTRLAIKSIRLETGATGIFSFQIL